jgi:hypothetical protein
MTLMDAKEYDVAAHRRRRLRIMTVAAILIGAGLILYWNRYLLDERIVDKFFAALQKQDYETAYGIYFADPTWRQNPQRHSNYSYADFYRDWGPGGEWGVIKSYKIYAVGECPHGGSGVVVEVVVNNRAEHEQLYVQKSDKTLSPSPCS